jgi:hypothetical protein
MPPSRNISQSEHAKRQSGEEYARYIANSSVDIAKKVAQKLTFTEKYKAVLWGC